MDGAGLSSEQMSRMAARKLPTSILLVTAAASLRSSDFGLWDDLLRCGSAMNVADLSSVHAVSRIKTIFAKFLDAPPRFGLVNINNPKCSKLYHASTSFGDDTVFDKSWRTMWRIESERLLGSLSLISTIRAVNSSSLMSTEEMTSRCCASDDCQCCKASIVLLSRIYLFDNNHVYVVDARIGGTNEGSQVTRRRLVHSTIERYRCNVRSNIRLSLPVRTSEWRIRL